MLSLVYKSGGAKRSRTVDLLRARQALYQLSYGPIKMVGLGRLELPTPALSTRCSNQLSYRPLMSKAITLYNKAYKQSKLKNNLL